MQKSDLARFDLPDTPGVYRFKRGGEVLYVGKATSLRDRVRSYFDDDLIATRGPRIVDMITRADRIAVEPTSTVLEALVREAALIKKYQPKANVEGKDDKSFLYAVITRESWPRVLMVRGKDLHDRSSKEYSYVFGPFPSGSQLKEALRLIRKIFPFFDSPKPVGEGGAHAKTRIEFNTQIKHYPASTTNRTAYRKTIMRVALLLGGHVVKLRRMLEADMQKAAHEERFEDAARIRGQLYALNHIQDVSLIKWDHNYLDATGKKSATEGRRIEAYDTAHLAGTNAIGVMTVLIDGHPSKRDYRAFRIKGVQKNDDIASLREILSRRLRHDEWHLPDAIVVDGGRAQKKAAEAVLKEKSMPIPVVAVVKDDRHRPREVFGVRVAGITDADAVRANAEAHRFSLARHRAARARLR